MGASMLVLALMARLKQSSKPPDCCRGGGRVATLSAVGRDKPSENGAAAARWKAEVSFGKSHLLGSPPGGSMSVP